MRLKRLSARLPLILCRRMRRNEYQTSSGQSCNRRKPFTALENTNLHKTGKEVVLETSGDPFFDAEGKLAGYRGIDRNITERKRNEEKLNYTLSLLEATIESTADGILVVDRQGRIVRYNQKFAEMWNIPRHIMESRDDNRPYHQSLNN